jgi:hypothetical protein
MIRHVTLQRRDGDIALIDGVVVGAGRGAVVEILFADPEVRLAARIDVFADHRTRILDSLPRDANAFDFFSRNVDVEQTCLRAVLPPKPSAPRPQQTAPLRESRNVLAPPN